METLAAGHHPVAPDAPPAVEEGVKSPDPAGILGELFEQEAEREIDVNLIDVVPISANDPNRQAQWYPLPNISKLVLVACCGSFLFGFSVAILNTCLGHIAWEFRWCDYDVDPNVTIRGCSASKGYEGSVTVGLFCGAAIGAVLAGYIMRSGRRFAILVGMWLFFFGTATTACSTAFAALLWARLTVGVAVGIVSVAVPTFLSEITPPAIRGFYGIFHQLFIVTGIFVAVIIGLPLGFVDPVPYSHGTTDLSGPTLFSKVWWRIMVSFAAFPIALCLWLFSTKFPWETPHWYLKQKERGGSESARAILRQVHQKSEVTPELQGILSEVQSANAAKRAGMTLMQAMRTRQFRDVVLLGCVISAFQQLSGINVFISQSTDMFRDAGFSATWSSAATCGIFFINILMTLPAIWLIEKAGRRNLLIWGCAAQTASLLLPTVAHWINPDSTFSKYTAVAGTFGFIVSFAAAYGPVLWVYLFEVYPLEIKGGSTSLAVACNWLAAIALVFAAKYMNNTYKFTVFSGLSFVSVLIMLFFVRETKGRTLGDSPYTTS